MTEGRKLAEAIWPAINIEMMQSQAWSRCFTGDFRRDHYRQIANVVVLKASTSIACVLGELRREIADAFQIDDKTVASRIEKMENAGLLEIKDDTKDRRKRIVTPTAKLVAAYTRYSDHIVDFQVVFEIQLNKLDRPPRPHKSYPALHFDLLDHVEDLGKRIAAFAVPDQISIKPAKENK